MEDHMPICQSSKRIISRIRIRALISGRVDQRIVERKILLFSDGEVTGLVRGPEFFKHSNTKEFSVPQKYLPIITIVVMGFLLASCSGTAPVNLGTQPDGKFAPCPETPNCVSSFASPEDKTHYIPPIKADEKMWEKLPRILTGTPRIKITDLNGHYLRAEATTRILRFVDDLEFLYHPDQSLIHIRSASRTGRSDLGVNRKRIERIREQLQTK